MQFVLLFVDYCGQTLPVINRDTGELRDVQIFAAVLGASNYTYAEATWTQSLPDWIGSHVRAFAFFGGVVEQIIPDNLKSGVHSPCRYEPDLNPTYQDFAILDRMVHDAYKIELKGESMRKLKKKIGE